MRGKPFAAAFVAFLLVFLGGAAIAGVNGSTTQVVSPPGGESHDAPDKTTTTTAPVKDTKSVEEPTKDEKPERDTTPPRFEIRSPANNSYVDRQVIVVSGGVEPGAKVFLGDRRATVEGDDWKIEVELKKGINTQRFKAFDEAGNYTVRGLVVHYGEEGDTTPPRFEITSPANGHETRDKVIVVKGVVDPGAKVLVGDRRATVDGDNWKIEVELKKGKNILTFKAYDAAGNKSVATIYVYYVGGDHPDYEFWATQKYGSCGEEVPYDVFYGKGKPGSVIEVGSAYGSGRVEVGEDGHWELKVYFETAPFGESFKVTVAASTGETKYFHFVNTGEGH
jgi:hypothetical protein